MDKQLQKYILLNDRVGEHLDKGWLSSKTIPTQLLRGEIFEALPESEQPEDPDKIALVQSIYKQNQGSKLVCPTLDVSKIMEPEADLLAAISSTEERFRIYRERNRLTAGKSLDVGQQVFVKLKDHKEFQGVIWYIGSLPTHNGIMFGVELLGKESEGQGTCDGTFRNKKYFECPQDRGVFVALDKLCPRRDQEKSPKKETTTILSTIKDMIPSFSSKDSSAIRNMAKEHKLRIDQRVIVFPEDDDHKIQESLRGTLRFISERVDSHGDCPVGIELDKRKGSGTGIFKGRHRFVCKEGYALFVPVTSVFPEEEYDESKQANIHPVADRLGQSDGFFGASLGYHEANSGSKKSENGGIKRSNSATSISSSLMTSEEEQKRILEDIKAKQSSKPENQIDGLDKPVKDEHLSFEDEHFKKSPKVNSEWPQPHSTGHSTFYQPRDRAPAPCHEETPQGSTNVQTYSTDKTSVPENKYNNIRPSGSGTQETKNINYTYNPANSASSTDRNQNPSRSYVEGSVTSTNGIEQHEFTGLTQSDIEMRVDQFGTNEEDVSRQIDSGLEVGSMVEVPIMQGKDTQYGVIRWIGQLPELPGKTVAGLELETEQAACSNGMFGGKRYFTCPGGRAFFVNLHHCRRDSRFQVDSPGAAKYSGKAFGSIESPIVTGTVPPPNSLTRLHQGKMKGIQGHHNSCYLDSTLYSMFSFTTVFDSLLHRAKKADDLDQYDAVQGVLKEHIVNPLRSGGFVRADYVLKLRRLLDELGSTSGLMNEEKDPEEFLNTLLHQVLQSDALLKLKTPNNRTEETNYYQIITEKDDTKKSQPVQKLLEQSFLFSDLKLAEVPSCMILQMPRFGKRYKMYDFILPNLKLDITHILENVPRECSVCGAMSTYECKDCYPEKHELSSLSYCDSCVKRFHSKRERTGHKYKPIAVPRGFRQNSCEPGHLPIETMDLFAVVCIATSHYVAFVKCGTSADSEWCFFDSMADRKGEINGYNIPVVSPCPEAKEWLSKKDEDIVRASEQGQLPPNMKRLFGDAYMCLYQNLEMTMYK